MANGEFIIGSFPRLSMERQHELNSEYTKKEVYQALKGIRTLKAPRLDGFHEVFCQTAWNTIGDNVSSSVLNTLKGDKVQPGWPMHC